MRPLKMVPCAELLVDVDGVVVAGHGGEQDDVGFRDGLGERGAHPDPQILQMRNLRAHSSDRALGLYGNSQFTFGCCQDLHTNASRFNVR